MILWSHNAFPRRRALPSMKFIVVNGQTTTSAFHKSNATTVIMWGGPNYGHLRQVSLWHCVPKIITVGQCFTELFKK